jgi:ubiquinone/menaquinone biosynthesis C-methylase UbiE
MRGKTQRPEGSEYLLGSQTEELERLASQHTTWTREAHALWRRAGFGPGQRLIDLGCGPGFAAFDLAQIVGPSGRVVAVDNAVRFLEHLRLRARERGLEQIEVVDADVRDFVLPTSGFDGAYARWLLCFVDRPDAVVAAAAQALRHGGVLAINDYFNYRAFTFAPRSEVMDRVVAAVQDSWQRHGGDLDIQSRMPAILDRCGFEVLEIRPITHIARPASALWNWPLSFFRGFLPTLVDSELISPEDAEAFLAEWDARSADSSSFLFLPPLVDILARRR